MRISATTKIAHLTALASFAVLMIALVGCVEAEPRGETPDLALQTHAATSGAKCETTATYGGKSGTFTDGTRPTQDYANDLNLCFTVKPDREGLPVNVWLERLDLEEGYDVVRVYEAGGKLIAEEAEAGAIYSSAKGITLNFITDDAVTATGFTARYGAIEEDEVDDAL